MTEAEGWFVMVYLICVVVGLVYVLWSADMRDDDACTTERLALQRGDRLRERLAQAEREIVVFRAALEKADRRK